MRFLPIFFVNLLMLFSLSISVKAQSGSAYSRTFSIQAVKDNIPPEVKISSLSNDRLNVSIHDDSGIDTVWFNEETFKVRQDTVFSFGRKIVPGIAYRVRTVDIKGNEHEETFAFDEEGMLMRGVIPVHTPKRMASMLNARYFALMIGVEDYADESIEDLLHPVEDMKRLSAMLSGHYTFEQQHIQVLTNPSKIEIERKLDELKDIVGEDDNLLIFYAGHGYWNEDSQTGSWLPADAKKNRSSTWVRNSTVRDYIKEINSRHTLLITDACFGGSIFKTRGIENNDLMKYNALYNAKSRRAMTSSNLQLVPDQSMFMKFLLDRLEENTDDYLPAESLFNRFKLAVINNSYHGSEDSIIPQYGVISDVGDEGGDFIFIRK